MAKPQTPDVDWERIEAQFCAGVMSLREICAAHDDKITEGAIRKRAKKAGWLRDLTVKVRAKADDLVRKELVRAEAPDKMTPTERETVEVEAQVQARIAISHRHDITRLRKLCVVLIEECEAQSGDLETFRNLSEVMAKVGEDGIDRLRDAYNKVLSLPTRIKGVKELADTLRTLVTLEREAYGLDKAPDTPPGADAGPVDINDAARRVAFILATAAAQKGAAHG